jgi:aminopeptidase N
MLRKDYQAPNFSVSNTKLDFLILDSSTVYVNADYKVQPKDDWDGKLTLNGGNTIDLLSIKINKNLVNLCTVTKVETSYGKDLVISDVSTDKSEFTVSVSVKLDPSANTSLEGLYVSDGVLVTQCESHGFRNIIYGFDRPDVLSKYKVRISASQPSYPVLLSNGNVINKEDFDSLDNSFGELSLSDLTIKTEVFEDPFAKPSYLFCMVAGELENIYDTFTTKSGKSVDLYVLAKSDIIGQCHFAMAALKRAMSHDEEQYDLEYDLDNYKIVAIDDFNAGAMENKGLNVFNSKYVLADPKFTSDGTYAGIDSVIAHEYFHNYTGNRVTLRDWFELTLKEGLTVFRDQEYSELADSYASARVEQSSTMKGYQFSEDAGPTSHPIRPDEVENMSNFYTSTVYNKGAEIIRMISTMVGSDVMHKAVKSYLDKFDGQAVACEDFVAAIEEYTGADLQQFRLWYSQNGTPKVNIKRKLSTDKSKLKLTIEQSYKEKGENFKPFHIPFKMKLFNPENGESIPTGLENDILHIKNEIECFTFDLQNVDTMPLLSGLRDFSSPVVYTSDMTDMETTLLMTIDDSEVTVIELFSDLKNQAFLKSLSMEKPTFDPIIFETINKNIALFIDNKISAGTLSDLITIPSSAFVKTQVETIVLEKMFECMDEYNDELSRHCSTSLFKAIEFIESVKIKGKLLIEHVEFDYNVAKYRTLKYQLLSKFSCIDPDLTNYYVQEQIKNTKTFSDQSSLLSILVNTSINLNCRPGFIAKCHSDWEGNLNAFSALISTVCSAKEMSLWDTISQYEPLVDRKNPNMVRAFLGGVAGSREFCSLDGKGYTYMATWIEELDKSNPSLAANLINTLNYQKHKDERKTILRSTLLDLDGKVKSSQLKEKIKMLLSA